MDASKQKISLSDLDPIDRASEVVFGTLMAMSFSGTLSVATAGEQDVHTMMLAALGCNLAWGMADGVMYLVSVLTESERKNGLLRRLHHARSRVEADTLIAEELPERLKANADPAVFDALRKALMHVPEPKTTLDVRNYIDALLVFLLVVLSTLPIVVPFMLIDEPMHALRVSNALGVGTLFLSGYQLGRYSGGSAWRFGLGLAAVGAAMVGIIIFLGG